MGLRWLPQDCRLTASGGWSVSDGRHDGRRFRMLNIIDEFTHECLAIRINRKLKAIDIINVLSDPVNLRARPHSIRQWPGVRG
jgi:putative transposase